MSELKVTEKIDLKGLRAAFVIEIKQHHTDKGGELMKSQVLFVSIVSEGCNL